MPANNSQIQNAQAYEKAHLLSRHINPVKEALEPGLHSLQIAKNREALLYVPKGYKPEKPATFALMLHGAGGNAQHGISLLQNLADKAGIIILSPKSFHATWDVIADEYGVDVEFIDQLLENTFERFAIDKMSIAVGGFSDGASYALSLGITNGTLFTHVLAYSPGFMAATRQTGNPRFYISHGTQDSVLPIEHCSRKIAPQLKRAGYEVIYREFDGPHTIPADINQESIQWFIK